jgi:hypothetical protein
MYSLTDEGSALLSALLKAVLGERTGVSA